MEKSLPINYELSESGLKIILIRSFGIRTGTESEDQLPKRNIHHTAFFVFIYVF